MHKYHKVLLFVLFLIIQTNNVQAGEPTLLYVGQSGACTYTSLQAAIDDASSGDEIRVSNEFFNDDTLLENISIDKDLTIKGGYSTCGLAQLDSRLDTNRTIIDGTESGNVIKIDSNDLNVHISGFTLTGGVNEGPFTGGGVSIDSIDSAVIFSNMTISGNRGRIGGGIMIWGLRNQISLNNTLIDGNSAGVGGGVSCVSPEGIIFTNGLIVTNNHADDTLKSSSGGGFYLSDCALSSSQENILRVANNQADKFGGGIYAVNNSRVHVQAIISDNEAGSGGGIYASSSWIIFDYSELSGNQAHGGIGGGLYAIDSDIFMSETGYNNCLAQDEFKCLHFIGNRANIGGAMYLDNTQSQSHLPGVYRNNRANFGSAFFITSGSDISMQNAYIFDNGSGNPEEHSTVFIRETDTHAQFSHTTLANNQTNAVFYVEADASLDLINSIVYEDSDTHAVLANDSGSVHTGCNLYHESNSVMIPVGDNSVVTDDPGFVDPATDDYHLRPDSVGIDFCDDAGLEEINRDSDLHERPIDIPDVANGLGSYDAGADEVSIDLIFENGFEDQ